MATQAHAPSKNAMRAAERISADITERLNARNWLVFDTQWASKVIDAETHAPDLAQALAQLIAGIYRVSVINNYRDFDGDVFPEIRKANRILEEYRADSKE